MISIKAIVLKFARCGEIFGTNDVILLNRTCEVIKSFLYIKALRFVHDHRFESILYSYSGDCTPVLTKFNVTAPNGS